MEHAGVPQVSRLASDVTVVFAFVAPSPPRATRVMRREIFAHNCDRNTAGDVRMRQLLYLKMMEPFRNSVATKTNDFP